MKIVCMQIIAYLPQSQSLKDKRSVIKRLMAMLSREFGVSVCEDGLQNDKQWIQLGLALACADMPMAQRMEQSIQRRIYDEWMLSRLEIRSEIY